MTTLHGLSDIRNHFHRRRMPTYFVSATPFNLLGMDEWCRDFTFVNYIDCFDGAHPSVFVPTETAHPIFESIEQINNYLLAHDEVRELIDSKAPSKSGPKGEVVFLFFDEETERLCKELGLSICFPSAKLRNRMDDKLMTTRIGDEAGVPSVPNALTRVGSYDRLRQVSSKHGLGEDLVVQTAFGDSGHTTFFISSERDYDRHAADIEAEKKVKVMKRVRCRGAALEACVTRHGTIVGPLMTELVGFSELTPYKGGWCGNEVLHEAFPQEVRDYARDSAFKIGEALRRRRYRGYFELDFLTDLDTGDVYLGEMNPRITGASSMTNLAAFAQSDAPLFLFHLLECSGVDFELDVRALNERWAQADYVDDWAQMVIKHTGEDVQLISDAPQSGVWELHDDGTVEFIRSQTHRRTVRHENRAFFLRIAKEGDWFYEGADLGILVMRGRLMTKGFRLTKRARRWIDGIHARYAAGTSTPVGRAEQATRVVSPGFKLL